MTLACGDLQGCRQPLEQLLRKIGPAPTETLWFCGDLVNRGPDSLCIFFFKQKTAYEVPK